MDTSDLLSRYAAGECDFHKANLRGASLSRAFLDGVNLRGANLEGARNLTQDQLHATLDYEDAKDLPAGL